MAKDYWRRVRNRARAEALRAIGWESREKLIMSALGVLAALLALTFWGSADASRDELIARLGIALILVFGFPIVWALRMLRLPAEMETEQQVAANVRIDGLQNQIKALDDASKPRIAFDKNLSALRSKPTI